MMKRALMMTLMKMKSDDDADDHCSAMMVTLMKMKNDDKAYEGKDRRGGERRGMGLRSNRFVSLASLITERSRGRFSALVFLK